jgi:hypothetical protein
VGVRGGVGVAVGVGMGVGEGVGTRLEDQKLMDGGAGKGMVMCCHPASQPAT